MDTGYYSLGRAVDIDDDLGDVHNYVYEGPRMVSGLLGNGVVMEYEHDGSGRLTAISETASSAVMPIGFDFEYDAVDRRINQSIDHAPSLSQVHEYDSLGRLTGVFREMPWLPARPAALASTLDEGKSWEINVANDWEVVSTTNGGSPVDETGAMMTCMLSRHAP